MLRLFYSIILMAMLSIANNAKADTLYDDLGGQEVIEKFIIRTLDLSVTDERIAHTLERTDMDRLGKLIVEQVCELTGGPCKYSGVSMQKSHVGLGLTTAHFNALVEHLQQAMSESEIPNSTQNKLLALLAPMHRDVVEE